MHRFSRTSWTLKEKAQFVTRNGLDEPLTFRGTVTVIDEDDVETLFLGLAEDYVLLEHNKKPNWMIGSAIFLGGLALLGFGFGSFFHSRRRRKRVEMCDSRLAGLLKKRPQRSIVAHWA